VLGNTIACVEPFEAKESPVSSFTSTVQLRTSKNPLTGSNYSRISSFSCVIVKIPPREFYFAVTPIR
jgi:hypothetical protein